MPIPKVSASDVKKMIKSLPLDEQKALIKSLQSSADTVQISKTVDKRSFGRKVLDKIGDIFDNMEAPDYSGDICGSYIY